MKWRLLLDIEVIEFLQTLPAPVRQRLFAVFRRIQDFPENYRQFTETDPAGRLLSALIFEGCAIYYWEDVADRHIRVMRV
jgi:plasmid stabilization system protein ParE